MRLFLLFFMLCTFSSYAGEKIYAIMITGKDEHHFNLANNSIQSFLEQSYPNKELVIINDGEYNFDHIQDDRVREIHLNRKYPLGSLRNIGLEAIPKNAVWMQWDDDDWHHPEVMKRQYDYMISNGADMCLLSNQVQYCFRIDSAWVLSRRGIPGTVMCRNKKDIRYPLLNKDEDTQFYRDYRKKYKASWFQNPPHLYLRFIHGSNTCDEEHFGIAYRKENSWNLDEISAAYLSKILHQYF